MLYIKNLQQPKYFDEFKRYQRISLILIAVDQLSTQVIRRLNGACLLCDADPMAYDLNFCINREVWVLYAFPVNCIAAMQLARVLQWIGAGKVFAILMDARLAKEVDNGG